LNLYGLGEERLKKSGDEASVGNSPGSLTNFGAEKDGHRNLPHIQNVNSQPPVSSTRPIETPMPIQTPSHNPLIAPPGINPSTSGVVIPLPPPMPPLGMVHPHQIGDSVLKVPTTTNLSPNETTPSDSNGESSHSTRDKLLDEIRDRGGKGLRPVSPTLNDTNPSSGGNGESSLFTKDKLLDEIRNKGGKGLRHVEPSEIPKPAPQEKPKNIADILIERIKDRRNSSDDDDDDDDARDCDTDWSDS